MSAADSAIQYLIDTIKVHRNHNMPKIYVPQLTGIQRVYLTDLGLTFAPLNDCCVINLK